MNLDFRDIRDKLLKYDVSFNLKPLTMNILHKLILLYQPINDQRRKWMGLEKKSNSKGIWISKGVKSRDRSEKIIVMGSLDAL